MDASTDRAKAAAARVAVDFIHSDMRVGLGTGSTAAFFITFLGKRCREGLNITAVATSIDSQKLAQREGIPLIPIDAITTLDITVDGADQVDPQKNMVKGAGGALLREKIVANMSREMIVIIDEHKKVNHLGNIALPIEILPFAYKATLHQLQEKGFTPTLRMKNGATPYLTDNGNYICHLALKAIPQDLEKIEQMLHAIPGVLETGLFLGFASRVIVGFSDGKTEQF